MVMSHESYQLTQRRASAAMAFLAPNRWRRNLTVRMGAQVRRITFAKGRATGVEMMDGSRIEASREVILSSGAIGSPPMLPLSGVGPADALGALSIDVVLDQPNVGANLQDHLDLYAICEVTGPHTYDRFAKLHLSVFAALQYLLTPKGPVASSLFETGGSGMLTPMPVRPISRCIWAWALGSKRVWRPCPMAVSH